MRTYARVTQWHAVKRKRMFEDKRFNVRYIIPQEACDCSHSSREKSICEMHLKVANEAQEK